jgi:hypothetical protein
VALDPTLVARFKHLFRGRENCYGQYSLTPHKDIKTVRSATPDAAWLTHLEGTGPFLGMVPITQANTCYFAAIDVDDDGIDHRALAAAIGALKLPLLVCRSKSGGAHLYLFLTTPAPAKLVITKLKAFVAALNLSNPHDNRPIETFPKQARLKADEIGNWINLPYFAGDETQRYCVTDAGESLSLQEFIIAAEANAISAEELEVLVPAGTDPFVEGPPCLKTLHKLGYPDGTRNQGLYNVGIYLKLAHPSDWQDRLAHYNDERMDPPVDVREIKGIVQSLERREYLYKCSELPIQPHCDRAACKKAKFGIGGFEKKRVMELFPALSELTKIETDPPRYTLKVNDALVECTADDLLSLHRFRRIALERADIIVPLIKQVEWDDMLRELKPTMKVVAAPETAGVVGTFRRLTREFLEQREHASGWADVLDKMPYEDKEHGKVFFQLPSLVKFLEKKGFVDYSVGRTYVALQQSFQAAETKRTIENQTVELMVIEAKRLGAVPGPLPSPVTPKAEY